MLATRIADLELGWLVGAAIGVGLSVAGFVLLRALLRRKAGWWGAVAAPLLLFGPAVGLILGSGLAGGTFLWGGTVAHAPANVGWSILLFFGATAVFALVRAFLQSRLVTEELGLRVPSLLLDAGRWLVWLVVVFVVVGVIWGKTEWFTGLLTASAIGTVIIGLALQETLQNLFAGISIVTEGAYAIGDWVYLGEHEGEVLAITRRTTKILTRNGDLLILPNRNVVHGSVRNLSRPTRVHAELLTVTAPYEAPPNRVREVLRAALRDVPGLLPSRPPLIRLVRYGERGIDYEAKIFLEDAARIPDIRSDAMVQFWYHLARAGIAFPYPVRDLRRLAPPAPPASPEDVAARLSRVPLFQTLPPDAFDRLSRDAAVETFATGERVLVQGQTGDACYVLDAGSAEVLIEDGGTLQQVAVLRVGDLFGEMGLLTGEPRSATVRALEDVRVLRIGAPVIRAILEAAPDVAQRLAEAAALRREGLAQARTHLDAEGRARVEERAKKLTVLIRRFFRLNG